MDFIFSFIVTKFKDYVLRNWKTTLVGAVDFLVAHFANLTPDQQMQLHAFALFLIGIIAKDGDKSGTETLPRSAEVAAKAMKAEAEKAAAVLEYTPLNDDQRPQG
jgi:hypothetical protein